MGTTSKWLLSATLINDGALQTGMARNGQHTVVPHTIVSHSRDLESVLRKDGWDISEPNEAELSVVSMELMVPEYNGERLMPETMDTITGSLQDIISYLGTLEEQVAPANVLVRAAARGRMEESKPRGYIVESRDGEFRLYPIAHLENLPLLAGYGSLMDPAELAADTQSAESRNLMDREAMETLADHLGLEGKMAYASVRDAQLTFNRAPTAARYGETQEERNAFAVLNAVPADGSRAYVMLFDADAVAEAAGSDGVTFFANQNAGEMEYNRLWVPDSAIEMLGGNTGLDAQDGAWLLYSPQVTDVGGKLEIMMPRPGARLHERYVGNLQKGLDGAESLARGFSRNYVTSALQPDGKALSAHPGFWHFVVGPSK